MKKTCTLLGVREVCCRFGFDDFSRSLFAFLGFSLLGSNRRPCQPPVRKTDAVQEFDQPRTLPALRFAGVQGWITSEAVGSGLASHISGIVPVRQCESSAYPDPSRRDHRTHAAYAAAEFSGSVRSRPIWAGCCHPMLQSY